MTPARDQGVDGDADPAERRNEQNAADESPPARPGPERLGDREVATETAAVFVDPPGGAADVLAREFVGR